eukprot:CAMPEP_0181114368 /NCGR_PEP_ID=MMETSP1071-20121207/20850_1 /TAXON_ID=35127 /ORGANISM="Thalassiosira sp., Strain NH16" /LENGTH=88 /DNA_ID=CAMNT_0023198481 /DNA_START=37 /DNA_END=300 /DNA_ORIENTATION=+
MIETRRRRHPPPTAAPTIRDKLSSSSSPTSSVPLIRTSSSALTTADESAHGATIVLFSTSNPNLSNPSKFSLPPPPLSPSYPLRSTRY